MSSTPAINSHTPLDASNFTTSFRDSFDSFTPGVNWTVNAAANDIVLLDGNAAGASYLTISLDPLSENTETSITSTKSLGMPVEAAFGLSISQRVLGNEVAVELVNTDSAGSGFIDLAISSISQTTTTLTVNTVQPHNLSPGNAISIYGVSDSRLNFPALVIATVPAPNQFTVTAGPAGNIASLTAGPYAQGFVSYRPRLGLAPSGSSIVFENATATNASFYSRSLSGDSIASGAPAGNHSMTVSTTVPTQIVNTPYAYAFAPSSEYRLALMADRLQWSDTPVDSVVQSTSRFVKTQVVPDNTKNYVFRIRARNDRSTTRPVAKIVSAVKTGTTTATIQTDVPHGLTTADLVLIYGNSTDAVAFPNVTTPTAIASVIDATHFTVVYGTAVSLTVYGGFVARAQGGNVPASFIPQAAISATLAIAADGVKALTLTGSAAWTLLSIGDYVNVHGLRNTTNGGDLGCDGAWKVRNINGTLLELGPIGSTVPPAVFGATVSGGAVIKRTDARLHFVRMFEFDRLRVEMLARPASDMSAAAPVVAQGGVLATVTSVTTVGTVNTVTAVTAAALAIPLLVADIASAALTSTTTTAAVTPTNGTDYEVNIIVTAVTGTTPTMDVVVQESDDNGTNWFDVYHFPRITAAGQYRSPKLVLKGTRVRYTQTVAGTSPSFTRSLNRLQGNSQALYPFRRIYDRTVSLTTLNAATASLVNASDCRNVQLSINIGAATTAPALQLQGSNDAGASWYNIGTPLQSVASSTVTAIVNNIAPEMIRAIVSTAGATVTAGYVELRAF